MLEKKMLIAEYEARCKNVELKKKLVENIPYQVQSVVIVKPNPPDELYETMAMFHNRRAQVKLNDEEAEREIVFIGICNQLKLDTMKADGCEIPRMTVRIEVFRPEASLLREIAKYHDKKVWVQIDEPNFGNSLDDVTLSGRLK